MSKIRICICGGGSLSHVCAGVLGSNDDVTLCVLTRKPGIWHKEISVSDCYGKTYKGRIETVSSDPEIVSCCDIILLCLPGYAIEETLTKIKPYSSHTAIGSIVCSTGFFYAAHEIFGNDARLFGFQRTPFIARTDVYGKSARLLGYKPQVSMVMENIPNVESFKMTFERLFSTKVCLLNNFYEASLTNSNPILHTGRLYSLWKDWDGKVFDHQIKFYEEWNDEASQTVIDMDAEFQSLLKVIPVSDGAIPSLLEYYESSNTGQLTAKIKSIPAFQSLVAPMSSVPGGWIPDFNNRYFTEDFPFGLRFVYQFTKKYNIDSPLIDKVYDWGLSCLKLR